MLARWQRLVFSGTLCLALVPFFLARTFPHDCHRTTSESHDDHPAIDSDHCALCDMAMPLTEAIGSDPLAFLDGTLSELTVGDVQPRVCATLLWFESRGPPLS